MSETLSVLPISFWAVIAVLAAGSVFALTRLRDGIGVPMLAVMGTAGFWYAGDALYNDYASYHVTLFSSAVLDDAFWEVALFLIVFLIAAPKVHGWINRRQIRNGSGILQMFKTGVDHPLFQAQIKRVLHGSAIVWLIIAAVATVRLNGAIIYYLFPFLGNDVQPWGRGRLGGGIDALLSLAFYIQMLCSASFGIAVAGSTDRRTRWLAIILCLLSWPCIVFDRTRNTTLAVVMPGVLTWGFLRVRGGLVKKFAALGVCFVVINAWMGFIIENRSAMAITSAIRQKGFSLVHSEKVHHEGLNMYEELCWINTFIREGTYDVNWGKRYVAEAVNFVPRVIWKNKPEIGIDYAMVRGAGGGSASEAGVSTTFSTGMIGQGVVNFGTILGPAFAALLMSLWAAVLARLDLGSASPGNALLYSLGLILTFNMGRDITLITLYPFIFGTMLIWWHNRRTAANQPVAGYSEMPVETAPAWSGTKPGKAGARRIPRLGIRPISRVPMGVKRGS